MAAHLLGQAEIDEQLGGLAEGWTGSPEHLERSIEFADFQTAVDFIARLAPRCDALDHHPDLDLRWRRVDISLATHSDGGVTSKDVTLAEVVDEVAGEFPLAER